jgi:hypothetical protein
MTPEQLNVMRRWLCDDGAPAVVAATAVVLANAELISRADPVVHTESCPTMMSVRLSDPRSVSSSGEPRGSHAPLQQLPVLNRVAGQRPIFPASPVHAMFSAVGLFHPGAGFAKFTAERRDMDTVHGFTPLRGCEFSVRQMLLGLLSSCTRSLRVRLLSSSAPSERGSESRASCRRVDSAMAACDGHMPAACHPHRWQPFPLVGLRSSLPALCTTARELGCVRTCHWGPLLRPRTHTRHDKPHQTSHTSD